MQAMATGSSSSVMALLSEKAASGRRLRALLVAALVCLAQGLEASNPLEELVQQTHPVDPVATLSVRNMDGSIAIRVSDVAAISIRATKRAYTTARLRGIVVDVKAAPDRVSIETIVPPGEGLLGDRSGTVDYVITIPKTVRIEQLDLNDGEVSIEGLRGGSAVARVGNGWLAVRNCFADLDLAVTDGRLQVAYDRWEESNFRVVLASPEGDIRVNFPSEASVNIVARTVSGRIVNGLGAKQEEENGTSRFLSMTTGSKPGASFEMSTTTGDIRINKPY